MMISVSNLLLHPVVGAKQLRLLMLGCVIAGLLSSCSTSQPDGVLQADLRIHNIQLVDVEAGQLRQGQTVLVKADRIVAIVPDAQAAKWQFKEELDGQGQYLTPALWDMHVHFEGRDLVDDNALLLPVYLAYGITAVREAASNLAPTVLRWRAEVASGQRLGPRIFTAGQKFEGINSLWDGDLEIGNEQQMRAGMDLLQSQQVDFIKITENTLAPDLYLATIREAHKRGLLVSSHVPYGTAIDELAQAGLSSIEHASYLLRLGFTAEADIAAKVRIGAMTNQQAAALYRQGFDQDTANAGYRRLAAAGVAVTPTLIGGQQLAHLHETDHSHDAFLRYLSTDFTANYQWRIERMAGETPAQQQERKDKEQLIAAQLPYLQQAGVLLLAGSDSAALNTYVYPAEALHAELQLWQQAGMQNADILRAATINGARFMRQSADYGSVTTGKKADLLLLKQNPLQDIGATRLLQTLVYQGKVYDRATLDLMLQQAAAQKQQLDQQPD
jgi:imidazolonepropionase-like amidohydrolase